MKELRLRHKGIYHTVCLLISITAALIVWTAVSAIPDIGSVFVSPVKVWNALVENISSGYLWIQVRDSLIRVIGELLQKKCSMERQKRGLCSPGNWKEMYYGFP